LSKRIFLLLSIGLGYNKLSCTEPFRLVVYARKNSKRLLCGLFCISVKAGMEVKMIITLDKGQENGGLKQIKVEGVREKEKEVTVRHKIVSSKWRKWNYGDF
jgi:hypothetical protein